VAAVRNPQTDSSRPAPGSTIGLTAVKSFDDLWTELSAKVATGAEGSGTVDAVERGVHAVGKKVVEEAAEAWMAAEHEGPGRAADEIAQLLYHVQVLMLASGVGLDDVYERL
jgi:phosphoribosyl-ATP pyrophosphohydrolase